jgi:hypothetical protein
MMVKWSFFAGAALLAADFVFYRGIPVFAVLTGCGLAALATWRKLSRAAPQRP